MLNMKTSTWVMVIKCSKRIKYLFQHYLCFQLGGKNDEKGITTWNPDFGIKV